MNVAIASCVMRVTSLLLVTLFVGCASAPPAEEKPIENGAGVARSVALCKTKVADLESQLGAPSRDGLLGRARVVTWVVAWDPLVKYLGVMADNSGTVVDVYWDLPSEIQWSPVNRFK